MKQIKHYILVALIIPTVILCAGSGLLEARTIPFDVSVDQKEVSLGESVQMKMTFEGTQKVPAPQIPNEKGMESRYIGPSTMMSFVNGKMSRSITHVYVITPMQSGNYHLGPFRFNYGGNIYESNDLEIVVTDVISRGSNSAVQRSTLKTEERTGIEDYVFLTMEVGKRKAYMNERIALTVRLFVNRFTVRDIQYPEFDHTGFSMDDYSKPRQYQKIIDGLVYDIIEFRTFIFGTRPGVFSIGPTTLDCNLLIKSKRGSRRSAFNDFFQDDFFNGFFGRYEQRPITTEAPKIDISIMPLPDEGKPTDYSGALGDFTLDVSAEPTNVMVGDPITLTMKVKGDGNWATVSVPQLASVDGFKLYDPQVEGRQQSKVFEQVIIPTREEITEIPVINFSFFNTKTGAYETRTQKPIPITVTKSDDEKVTLVERASVSGKTVVNEILGRDLIYIKETPGALRSVGDYWYTNRWYWLGHSIPPALFVLIGMLMRRRERLKTDEQYARRLYAPKQARQGIRQAEQLLHAGEVSAFYDAVFKTLQEYVGNKFHLPPGGITIDSLHTVFEEKAIAEEKREILDALFRACDNARYASSGLSRDDQQKIFSDLKDIIDYLERLKI